jgi:hypothetical protein
MFSRLIKNLFKETTNVTDVSPVTFNSSGSYNPKYGKKQIIITGQGAAGNFVPSTVNPFIPAGANPGPFDGGDNSYNNNPQPVAGDPSSFYPGVPSSFYPGEQSSSYPGDPGGNFANWNYTTQVIANGVNAPEPYYTPEEQFTNVDGFPESIGFQEVLAGYNPGSLIFAPTEVITGSNVNLPIPSSTYPGIPSSFYPGIPSSFYPGNEPYIIPGQFVQGYPNRYPPEPYPSSGGTTNSEYSNTGSSTTMSYTSSNGVIMYSQLSGGYGGAASPATTYVPISSYDKTAKTVTVPSGGYVTVTIKIR